VRELEKLERLGYQFILAGEELSYKHWGHRPAEEEVRPLLEYVKQHRDELVAFLKERAALLDQIDTMVPLEWCRLWADFAERAGYSCTDSPSWSAWLAKVERDFIPDGNSR
jgi:hypothetical protein